MPTIFLIRLLSMLFDQWTSNYSGSYATYGGVRAYFERIVELTSDRDSSMECAIFSWHVRKSDSSQDVSVRYAACSMSVMTLRVTETTFDGTPIATSRTLTYLKPRPALMSRTLATFSPPPTLSSHSPISHIIQHHPRTIMDNNKPLLSFQQIRELMQNDTSAADRKEARRLLRLPPSANDGMGMDIQQPQLNNNDQAQAAQTNS